MKKIAKVLMIGLAVFGMLSFFGCDNAAGGGDSATPVDVSSFNEDLSGDWDMVRSGTGMGGFQGGTGVVTIEKSTNEKYKIYGKPGTEMKIIMTSPDPCGEENKVTEENKIKTRYPNAEVSWSDGNRTMTVVYTLTEKEGLNNESADKEYSTSELIEAMFNLGSSMSFDNIYSNSSNTKFYASKTESGQTTTFIYTKK